MPKNTIPTISKQALKRMPYYLQHLKESMSSGMTNISSPMIAAELGLNDVQVRKDLASVSSVSGRPKTGYDIQTLIEDIEEFLGYRSNNQAALVGVGHLGRALLNYKGFTEYGVEIVAAFDKDPAMVHTSVAGKQILPMEKLEDLCHRLQIHMGIITVGAPYAQEVCDQMVACGIGAIWNFAPVHLQVPDNIILQNENMASSLAVLSRKLQEKSGGKQELRK